MNTLNNSPIMRLETGINFDATCNLQTTHNYLFFKVTKSTRTTTVKPVARNIRFNRFFRDGQIHCFQCFFKTKLGQHDFSSCYSITFDF